MKKILTIKELEKLVVINEARLYNLVQNSVHLFREVKRRIGNGVLMCDKGGEINGD